MTPGWQKGVGSVIRPATLIPPPPQLVVVVVGDFSFFPLIQSHIFRAVAFKWHCIANDPHTQSPQRDPRRGFANSWDPPLPGTYQTSPISLRLLLPYGQRHLNDPPPQILFFSNFLLSFFLRGTTTKKLSIFFLLPEKEPGPYILMTHLFFYLCINIPSIRPSVLFPSWKKKRQISFMRTHFPRGKRDKREPSLWHEK